MTMRLPLSRQQKKEADEFARNALNPSELWKGSFVRFTGSGEQVLQFAKRSKVGVSIVAGRIRRERGEYTLFSDMIGQGEAKRLIRSSRVLED